MKREKWIGSKYYGYLFCYPNKTTLHIMKYTNCTTTICKGIKIYKYKQSAIRYIKNNFQEV